MVRRTLKNMEKATKLIFEKSYSWEEANKLAMQCFDNAEIQKDRTVEWFIDKIIPYEQWECDTKSYTR